MDRGDAAIESGNSEKIIRDHYLNTSSLTQAKAFWKIEPKEVCANSGKVREENRILVGYFRGTKTSKRMSNDVLSRRCKQSFSRSYLHGLPTNAAISSLSGLAVRCDRFYRGMADFSFGGNRVKVYLCTFNHAKLLEFVHFC
jgi:hypothetical protein